MKSLNQYINEVSSDLLKRAHNAQVKRNGGVESNRSRKFAKGAHAALYLAQKEVLIMLILVCHLAQCGLHAM